MPTAPYNAWYDHTYDVIRRMANWSVLSEDVPNKVVCIYSWMPHTLMGTRHAGGGSKWSAFSMEDVQRAARAVDTRFLAMRSLALLDADLDELNDELRSVIAALVPLFGTVAASKYLHFSAPSLFPMWDREIRRARGHADTVDGFIEYMRGFKTDLEDDANMCSALAQYPANAVRGWDMVNMRSRPR